MRYLSRHSLNLLREFSIPLISGVLLALVWANIEPSGYHRFNTAPLVGPLSFHFIANEIFMVLFFGIAAVEITQSCLPGGDLNPFSRAMNTLFATLGGVVGPALFYTVLNVVFGTPELARGWGIPTATDIALAWLAARMIFGSAHPAVSYLLLLAVLDDAIGLLIIAIFYTDPLRPVEPLWLLLTVAGMAAAYLLRRFDVRTYWPFVIIGGGLSWSGLHLAHLHPALALVFVIPFLPHAKVERKNLFEDDLSDRSPMASFEHEWKVLVDFGLFIFGIANAGVEFSSFGTVTWLVLVSLVIGKFVGIFSFGWIADLLGFSLPNGMRKIDLCVVSLIAGTGFTVALFMAGEAFADEGIKSAAKMGAVLSALTIVLGLVMGKVMDVKRQ
jgi:NhaA family Na+:H+ antiporter